MVGPVQQKLSCLRLTWSAKYPVLLLPGWEIYSHLEIYNSLWQQEGTVYLKDDTLSLNEEGVSSCTEQLTVSILKSPYLHLDISLWSISSKYAQRCIIILTPNVIIVLIQVITNQDKLKYVRTSLQN